MVVLTHSSGPWKKHKYIRKEGNRYIYKEISNPLNVLDSMKENQKKINSASYKAQNDLHSYIWSENDNNKSVIGKGYSWVMRFLSSGDGRELKVIDGKEYRGSDEEVQNQINKAHEEFEKRWKEDLAKEKAKKTDAARR